MVVQSNEVDSVCEEYVKDLRGVLESASVLEKKTFLKSFIKGLRS